MIRRLFTEKKGSTAVEFALVATPFIWMLLGLIELSLYFTSSSLLAEATNIGARQIRVGNLEGQSDPETAFRKIVCDRAAVFIPCNQIQFQVEHVNNDSFANAQDMDPTFDKDGKLQGAGYQDGAQSSVMLVRLVYRYPFMTPMLGAVLSEGHDNKRLIVNTIVMKNEPYDV